jgi:uncharacterized coiled-coil protein SlyX
LHPVCYLWHPGANMTLPPLLAVTLTESDGITLGLAGSLAGMLVVGSLAYARLHHRAETAEKALVAQEERLKALETWRGTTDQQAAELRAQVAEIFRAIERMERKLDDYLKPAHKGAA